MGALGDDVGAPHLPGDVGPEGEAGDHQDHPQPARSHAGARRSGRPCAESAARRSTRGLPLASEHVAARPPPGPHPADRLQRDVRARGAHRRDQPRPGLPRRGRSGRRSSRRRSRHWRAAPTSTPPASAYPRCGRRSRATSSATTASTSTPTPRSSSPPAAPRRSPRPCSGSSTRATRWSCSSPTTTPTSRCSTCAARAGARSRCGRRPRRTAPDLDELRAAVTDRTRVILLNTPHNPTGTVLTREELQVVADLAIEHDVIVVTDEVYEHLVFDDAASAEGHVPIATLPGMWERTLTLSSAGQVLLLHRLEGRLGHRARAARAGGAGRQAVAHLHLRRTAAAGRRARARPRAGLAPRSWPATSRRAATCSARASPPPG